MQYLDSQLVRIYIHDFDKNMFYELENLNDIKDGSILRIIEYGYDDACDPLTTQPVEFRREAGRDYGDGRREFPLGNQRDFGGGYFSEPEFDTPSRDSQFYGTIMIPANKLPSQYSGGAGGGTGVSGGGGGGSVPPAKPQRQTQRQLVDGYTSSPERRIFDTKIIQMERQLNTLTDVVTKHVLKPPSASTTTQLKGKPTPPPKPLLLSLNVIKSFQQLKVKTRQLKTELNSLLKQFKDEQLKTMSLIDQIKFKLTNEFQGTQFKAIQIQRIKFEYQKDEQKMFDDLIQLEHSIELLRSNVIHTKSKVNISHVESLALFLAKISKLLADLKQRFPLVHQQLKIQNKQSMDTLLMDEL